MTRRRAKVEDRLDPLEGNTDKMTTSTSLGDVEEGINTSAREIGVTPVTGGILPTGTLVKSDECLIAFYKT